MEENKKELKVIDIIDIAKKLWAEKKLYAKTLPIAFVIAFVYIIGVPRYYISLARRIPSLQMLLLGVPS